MRTWNAIFEENLNTSDEISLNLIKIRRKRNSILSGNKIKIISESKSSDGSWFIKARSGNGEFEFTMREEKNGNATFTVPNLLEFSEILRLQVDMTFRAIALIFGKKITFKSTTMIIQ